MQSELMELSEFTEKFFRDKQNYRFFDLNFWHAQAGNERLQPAMDIESLVRSMDGIPVSEAVVTSAECIEYSAAKGNESLLEVITAHPNLYGCLVWVPELARTRGQIHSYLEERIARKTVAIRMFPKKLRYSLNLWQVGDVLKVMESKRLPLILWHTETTWDAVHNLCEAFPNLPVIVEGNDQKLLYHNRSYVPLLAAHENLYLETHALIQHGEIEYLVNECGLDRLIYGAYYPYNDPNGSMMMITEAQIAEKTKFDIAGDHLRRLIGNIVH